MHTTTLLLVSSMLMLTCNEETTFTADIDGLTEPAAPTELTDVNGNTMTTPGGWPKCWLSSRLSAAQAAVVAGETPTGWSGKFLHPKGQRQEFRGTLKNPNAEGKCTLNWFGDDAGNANEPWINNASANTTKQGIQRRKEYASGYTAALTCTADATPECHCITAIPSNPGPDTAFGIGLCVRKVSSANKNKMVMPKERPVAGEDFTLFNYRQPDTSLPLEPAKGRCKVALKDLQNLYQQEHQNISARAAGNDGELTISGRKCRLDLEPFTARPEEATWYADSIRDWAVITCRSSSCRCFGTFAKSGTVDGERSKWFEYDTCVICGKKNGKPACSSAKL